MTPDGPLLWYVNRSTGLVLLVLLTLTLVLGVLSTRGTAGGRIPRFVVQGLHRNLGLLAMLMLGLHIASAVLDEYVDIRWWQSLVPWQLRYEPLWLALGVVGFDLVLAVVLTSMLRERLPQRFWATIHLATYAAWVLSVAHGLGIGTDTGSGWARWLYVGSTAVVAATVAVRVAGRSTALRSAAGTRGQVGVAR